MSDDEESICLYNRGLISLLSIQGLNEMTHLKSLNLHLNGITRIENLHNLFQLVELNLSSNHIEAIEGLENLKCLRLLDLSANLLTAVAGLENLLSLKVVDLSFNRIADLSGFSSCPGPLETVDLAVNQISARDLLHLAKHNALNEVRLLHDNPTGRLEQNPVCKLPNYRQAVIQMMPWLSVLDGESCGVTVVRHKKGDVKKAPANATQTRSSGRQLQPLLAAGAIAHNIDTHLTARIEAPVRIKKVSVGTMTDKEAAPPPPATATVSLQTSLADPRIAAYEDELKRSQQQVIHIQSAASDKEQQLRQYHEKLRNEHAELQRRFSALDEEKKSVAGHLSTMQSSNGLLLAQITALKEELSRRATEGKMVEQKAEIERAELVRRLVQKHGEEKSEERAKLMCVAADLETKLKASLASQKIFIERIAEAERERQRQRDEIRDSDKRRADAERSLRSVMEAMWRQNSVLERIGLAEEESLRRRAVAEQQHEARQAAVVRFVEQIHELHREGVERSAKQFVSLRSQLERAVAQRAEHERTTSKLEAALLLASQRPPTVTTHTQADRPPIVVNCSQTDEISCDSCAALRKKLEEQRQSHENDIGKLHAVVAELRSTVAERQQLHCSNCANLEIECENYQRTLSNLRESLAAKDEAIKSKDDELEAIDAEAREKIEEKRQQLRALSDKVEQLEKEKENAALGWQKRLEEREGSMGHAFNQLVQTVGLLRGHLVKLEAEKKGLEEDLDGERRRHEEQVAALRQQLQELTHRAHVSEQIAAKLERVRLAVQ